MGIHESIIKCVSTCDTSINDDLKAREKRMECIGKLDGIHLPKNDFGPVLEAA